MGNLKKLFWNYANYITGDNYTVDDENKNALQHIIETIEKQNKGIVLCGKTGSGKTFIFQILNKIYRPKFHPDRIKLIHVDSCVSNYDKLGDEGLTYDFNNTCFDELGRERMGKHYGSDCDVMQKLICYRYNLFKTDKILTYFTSNYSKADLKERYGDHCFSRLKEMCVFINMGTTLNYTDRRDNATELVNGFPEVLNPLNTIDIPAPVERSNKTTSIKNLI